MLSTCPLNSSVSLGELLNISDPPSDSLQSKDDDGIYFVEVLRTE